ncbi:unnamed protein product [Bursaphelenchus okinawaensis]|uniref:Uncharacterized protein n=1 Tax=Bursaphelenchus okinawaensis TaxID=465554 RepID=A0A811KBK4_9BILA|nr:unnamed protein product [Bursaphelenchus okinawaensis]CAG9097510.1 unnamed protein product [Bursaphelenchus okinawaensis]
MPTQKERMTLDEMANIQDYKINILIFLVISMSFLLVFFIALEIFRIFIWALTSKKKSGSKSKKKSRSKSRNSKASRSKKKKKKGKARKGKSKSKSSKSSRKPSSKSSSKSSSVKYSSSGSKSRSGKRSKSSRREEKKMLDVSERERRLMLKNHKPEKKSHDSSQEKPVDKNSLATTTPQNHFAHNKGTENKHVKIVAQDHNIPTTGKYEAVSAKWPMNMDGKPDPYSQSPKVTSTDSSAVSQCTTISTLSTGMESTPPQDPKKTLAAPPQNLPSTDPKPSGQSSQPDVSL